MKSRSMYAELAETSDTWRVCVNYICKQHSVSLSVLQDFPHAYMSRVSDSVQRCLSFLIPLCSG